MTNSLDHRKTTPTKLESQLDYILLDGSSSMQGEKWWESLAAIDAYIAGLKAQNVNTKIILHSFCSTDLEVIQRDCDIKDYQTTKESPIGSWWGMTPLYDAINLLCRKLRDLDPPRCAITIVTDGEEMGSQYTDVNQARAMLDWCRAKGWQVTFIGCDFSNSGQAAKLGANEASAIGVQKKLLSDAAANLAKKRARYGLYGDPMHFSDDEKQQFGGYLNPPTSSK